MSNAAAAAAAPFSSRYDRIDDEGEDQPFWLYDPEGVPVVIPPSCVGFQVRYWSPVQRGMGTLVTDARNGRPLILPRTTTPDEFAERVGYKVGRYRLFLLDEGHRRMSPDPGQVEITPEMAAARRGESSTDAGAGSSASSGDVLGQVLAFVEKANAQAMAQIAGVQRDCAESQRDLSARLGQVVDAMSGVLRAAGDSGVVQKTTALAAAAAGAPVIVHQVAPSNGNHYGGGSSSTAPRNAAGAATAAAAAEKGGGFGEAALMLLAPLFEKVAPVLAYGAAKKLDVPEEYARSVAGMVETTAKAAGQMLKAEEPAAANAPTPTEGPTPTDAAPVSPTVGLAPRVGHELMAHVLRIQGGLSEDDRAWVMGQMAARRGLVDAFKPAVAAITVEEGIRAVGSLRAMEAALTTPSERALFDQMLTPAVLPGVFRNLFVNMTTESAIEFVQVQAARAAAPPG